ncbi:hypothetical protein GCM10017709_33810 [Glutamicibacter nicotianae]
MLGVKPLYQGAGKVRRFDENVAANRGKKNAKASAEAAKRMTIAERRRAQTEQSAGSNASGSTQAKAQEENNE